MKFIQKCIFLLLASLEFTQVNSQEGFNNFLTMAMQDYPAWVVSSGLDPSPVIPDSINVSGSSEHVSIIGDIRNQQIFNYSRFFLIEVGSDVLRGAFNIVGYLENFKIIGEYEVSGHVFTNIPVTGSGTMHLDVSGVYLTIAYDNFAVTADGYVDLSVASYRYYNDPYFSIEVANFEGLSAGGFESNVADFVLTAYNNLGAKDGWLPVAKHIQTYLGELFEKTPLSEIIGTTLRPPTTPTTQATTTPTPEPTCPPCFTCPDVTCPPPSECMTCPTEPTCSPMYTEAPCEPCHTTVTPTTCPPSGSEGPRFSRTFYQTSLPAWPTQGFEIDVGIRAASPGGAPLSYELVTTFPFVELTESQHINFTMDVSEGSYVGPNNVMIVEVVAEVVDDSSRFDTATVIIVFPKGSAVDEN